MKEIFLEYAKKGAMTKTEVAQILKIPESAVLKLVRQKIIPTLPGLKPYRFDPNELIRVFCEPSKQVRSLTTERRSSAGKTKPGGFSCP